MVLSFIYQINYIPGEGLGVPGEGLPGEGLPGEEVLQIDIVLAVRFLACFNGETLMT